MPSSLIDEEDGVGLGGDLQGDLREVQVHRLGVAGGQDQGGAFALFRTDGTEDVGRVGALITWRARPGAAFRPPSGDLVLLADTSLVGEPDLYLVEADRLLTRDCVQAGGEAFLKPGRGIGLRVMARPGRGLR